MSINKSVQHTTAKKLGCPASLKGWGTSYSFHITLCLYLYGIIRLSSNHGFSLQSHFKTVTLSIKDFTKQISSQQTSTTSSFSPFLYTPVSEVYKPPT